jgi:hypothetical protein
MSYADTVKDFEQRATKPLAIVRIVDFSEPQ